VDSGTLKDLDAQDRTADVSALGGVGLVMNSKGAILSTNEA